MDPIISIIVPVYNMETYLEKCIDSIINQTYKLLEIILVDDGSTDGSPQICDKYIEMDDRIKVIHKNNGGLSSARNAGLDVCSGDYIGFVDSDDWISPTMYEELLALCKNDSTLATIGIEVVNSLSECLNKQVSIDQVVSTEDFLKKIIVHEDGGSVCSRLFPRKMIGNVRFDETKLNEDVLFLVSIISNIKYCAYTSSSGYYYLCRDGSTSRHFGKAVHDMVGNSEIIRKQIEVRFSLLSKEAEYFEIFQKMSFLLCCPSNYDRKADPLCVEVQKYIRKNILLGLKNPIFKFKDKLKLIGVSLWPVAMSRIVEKKAKNNHE